MADEGGIAKALDWAMQVDPEAIKARVAEKRAAFPDLSPREVAQKLVDSAARKGGAAGFLLGIPGNPLVAVPAAVGDFAAVLRFYAGLNAAVGFLANPSYFEDPDWSSDALLLMAGPEVVSHALKRAGIEGGKQVTKVLIKKYISKEVLKAIKKFVMKWFGRKITQRAILKFVPLVGGIVGGVWNYAEIRVMGGRAIAYHFGDALK